MLDLISPHGDRSRSKHLLFPLRCANQILGVYLVILNVRIKERYLYPIFPPSALMLAFLLVDVLPELRMWILDGSHPSWIEPVDADP